jgi:hypothetical protein
MGFLWGCRCCHDWYSLTIREATDGTLVRVLDSRGRINTLAIDPNDGSIIIGGSPGVDSITSPPGGPHVYAGVLQKWNAAGTGRLWKKDLAVDVAILAPLRGVRGLCLDDAGDIYVVADKFKKYAGADGELLWECDDCLPSTSTSADIVHIGDYVYTSGYDPVAHPSGATKYVVKLAAATGAVVGVFNLSDVVANFPAISSLKYDPVDAVLIATWTTSVVSGAQILDDGWGRIDPDTMTPVGERASIWLADTNGIAFHSGGDIYVAGARSGATGQSFNYFSGPFPEGNPTFLHPHQNSWENSGSESLESV